MGSADYHLLRSLSLENVAAYTVPLDSSFYVNSKFTECFHFPVLGYFPFCWIIVAVLFLFCWLWHHHLRCLSLENVATFTVPLDSSFLWMAKIHWMFPFSCVRALSFVFSKVKHAHHVLFIGCDTAKVAPYIGEHLIFVDFFTFGTNFRGCTKQPVTPCSVETTVPKLFTARHICYLQITCMPTRSVVLLKKLQELFDMYPHLMLFYRDVFMHFA